MVSFKKILGEALETYFRGFWVVFGTAVFLFFINLGANFLSKFGESLIGWQRNLLESAIFTFLLFLSLWLEQFFIWLFLKIYQGQERKITSGLWFSFYNLPTYLFLYILFTIIVVLGLVFLIVPGLVFLVWFSLVFPIFVNEGVGGFLAFRYSRELVRGYFGLVFGSIVVFIFSFLVGLNVFNYLFDFIISSTALKMSEIQNIRFAFLFFFGKMFFPLLNALSVVLYRNLTNLKRQI